MARAQPTPRTSGIPRRAAENAAMATLTVAARVLLSKHRVQDVMRLAERATALARVTVRARPHADTLARGRALAYRWSRVVPGCSCLHRAVSTQVWLGAFRFDSRVVLGVRKRAALEGHAWLEVRLPDAATFLFIEDEDGYPTELPVSL